MKFLELITLSSLFDFALIGLLLYRIGLMIKGTRAMSIFLGILIFAILYSLTNLLGLKYSHYIFSYFFDHLILIVILLFQEEIRMTLADFGRKATSIRKTSSKSSHEIADSVSKVADQMAKEHIGGLIVIERNDKLKSLIETGSTLYSQIKPELIYSIFLPASPIHDGAIIISKGEIAAAGCILPLSKDANLNKRFGTRHRAAIATSQNYDCVVVIISEETGQINLSVDGKMNLNLSASELKQALVVLQSNEGKTKNLIQQINELYKKITKK